MTDDARKASGVAAVRPDSLMLAEFGVAADPENPEDNDG